MTIEHRDCPLAYEVRGKGPPVVMIQGVGIHGGGWQPQVDVLQRHYTCLTFDNRGMGASQPADCSELTVEQMADDVRALMDAQGWDSAHVIGHSLGGLVAIAFALTHRARARSLALLCTFADGRIATRLTPRMLWLGLRTRIGPRRWRRRAFLRLVMPPQAVRHGNLDETAAALEPLFGHDLADQPPVTMKQLTAMKRYDATPRLAELSGLPTLIVSAFHDPIAPPDAGGRWLAAGIPGARYIEIPGASHGVTIHQPARINELLLEHLLLADDVHMAREQETTGSDWVQDA